MLKPKQSTGVKIPLLRKRKLVLNQVQEVQQKVHQGLKFLL